MMWRLLSVDIETGGPDPSRHPLLAIGTAFVVWNRDWRIERKRFVLNFEEEDFDPNSLSFWMKNRPVLEKMKTERKSDALCRFADYLAQLDADGPVTLISDNPTFDFGWITLYMCTRLAQMPVDFVRHHPGCMHPTPIHRKHVDVRSYVTGCIATSLNVPRRLPANFYETSHYPDLDAERCLKLFLHYASMSQRNIPFPRPGICICHLSVNK